MGVASETQHGEHCATGLQLIYSRMPEVEKQTSSVQEVESLEKPGGLAFQVLLEDAKSKDAPKMESPPTATPSVEDIQKRLKNAECRRKSMEASTLEKLALEEKKREEVRAKKASISDAPEEPCGEEEKAPEAPETTAE